jgi:aspartyl-tRNA(Asn)/glutamyl-tRNA(Gln) amidotransferase subunit B
MEAKYTPTIGLEVHAELKTQTKMFCNSVNNPDEEKPNMHVCPVCLAHPGTLPVINKKAVESVLRVGVAVGGELADFSEFDRKNYFYPDIPKAYQISQFKYPLVSKGSLAGVELTRIHLEEDTAKSQHKGDHSLVDFNRAGVPLMELVTEPVIHTAEDAGKFAKELQLLLRYLGVSDANMEKGEMRVEANISVSDTEGVLGTKVEVKNLNSFKVAEKAIEYEIARHTELLEKGETIVQETRGWDENTGTTFSQRQKEDSHDYRYFPDPDLPKLKISEIAEFNEELLRGQQPELPQEKRDRFAKDFSIKTEDIEMYVGEPLWGDFFEAVSEHLSSSEEYVLASNYITSDLVGLVKESPVDVSKNGIGKATPESLASLITLIHQGELSSRGGKNIIAILFNEGGSPKEIAEREGLFQKSDEGELKTIIQGILEENPKVVEEYKSGKEEVIGFLIGQAMKATKGSANPQVLSKVFKELL